MDGMHGVGVYVANKYLELDDFNIYTTVILHPSNQMELFSNSSPPPFSEPLALRQLCSGF